MVTTLTAAVARSWAEVVSNAVDPGWVPTTMGGAGAPDDLGLGHRPVRDWRFQDQLLEDLAGFTVTRLV